jgi:hypothetical protein
MVKRAAYKTDEETRHLVATLLPRPAPREGIRRLPQAPALPSCAAETTRGRQANGEGDLSLAEAAGKASGVAPEPLSLAPPPRAPSRASQDPVSADQWSVRLTIDGAFKEELETLKCLLSHKIPDGNLAAVLREAVRCAIEKHGKRRGAVKPAREREPAPPRPSRPGKRQAIPAAVRRAVWERDGGRCTYVSPGGRRCENRWRLELDHVQSAVLGGPSTIDGLRLRCRAHNTLHAEEVFGRSYMARFRRRPESRTGENAIASESAEVAQA